MADRLVRCAKESSSEHQQAASYHLEFTFALLKTLILFGKSVGKSNRSLANKPTGEVCPKTDCSGSLSWRT